MAGSLFGIVILLVCGVSFVVSACTSGQYRPVVGTGCKSYQACEFGRWSTHHLTCPADLLFNVGRQTCDWTYNIDHQTCTASSSSNPAFSTSPASTSQTGHYTQCGNKRCYHGTCWYSQTCNDCPRYNHHCMCKHGYTGESCSQTVDPVSSGPVSTSQTTTAHHSPHLGLWLKCGALHCYHSSGCGYTCNGARDYWGNCIHPVDYHCNCDAGYTGDMCTLNKVSDVHCYSRGLPCHSGHCVEDLTTSNYVCQCSSGYTGDGCQLRIVGSQECHYYGLRCDHGDCVADAHNSVYSGKHWCNCHKGYTGPHCDHNAATTVPTVNIAITTKLPTTRPPTSQAQTTTATPPTTTTATTTTTTTASTPPPSTTGSFSATSTMASSAFGSSSDTTSSTRNSSPHTSTAPKQQHHCNPTTTISAIINVAKASNNDIPRCPSGSSATPEAFVLAHCQLPPSSLWTQGLKVQQNCNNIPLYTPVATFNHERYSSTGGLSGIFLGCIQDGFKLGVQQCEHPPTILHVVSGGLFTMDPDVYFTVQ